MVKKLTAFDAQAGDNFGVSAAISGDCPPPATDQRGVVRPQGPACDIGAFELVVDSDGDGIANDVDTQPTVPSADFSDGTTFGSITNDGSLDITVFDDPTDGVWVSAAGGAGTATLTVCTEAFAVNLSAGDTVIITCGSVEVTVVVGSAQIDLGGGVIVTVSEGATATIIDLGGGEFTVEKTGDVGTVTVDDNGAVTVLDPDDPPVTVTTSSCADPDGDGHTTGRDVRLVARAMFTSSGHPRWDARADLNNDGVVSLGDLVLVIRSLVDRDCR